MAMGNSKVRNSYRSYALAAVVSLAASTPTVARAAAPQAAASDDATKEAIGRFKRGLELYKDGAFAAALIEFRKAYEIAPNYRVLYNIGQVCSEMQDYVCAVRSFDAYLAQATDLTPERRREVEQ